MIRALHGATDGWTGRDKLKVRLPQSGPVAQLGARMNGIHEVTGSIPVRSTISLCNYNKLNNLLVCFLSGCALFLAGADR